MEWNAKWDWENFVGIGSKSVESPKKLHAADWMLVDDGETHAGSLNLSGDAGNSNPSASDGGHGSPAKSSVSATTDSSTKDRFRAFEGSSGNFGKNMEIKETEVSKTSPPPEASLGSVESLIGLKLGKRTYFENSSGGGNVKSTSFSEIPPPKSTTTIKKTKSSGQSGPTPRCQVEGCNLDLSMAKEYHRKHRVCDNHSKSTKVIVGGVERRFCQQCSRFHSLSEFDDKKRSCRRRLSDHNARRRKPHQETIHFNSTRFSSPFYGGSEQMNFQLNNSPLVHSRAPPNSVWNSSCDSKFMLTREYPSKSFLDGASDKQLRIPVAKLPHVMNMHTAANLVSPFKNSMSEVLNPGSEGSLVSSVDAAAAAPEYRRALSLLSSHSWDSCEPESISGTQPMMQDVAIPEGVPLSSSDFWLTGQHSAHQPRLQSLSTNSHFQEIQLFRTPSYEADFYSNMLN